MERSEEVRYENIWRKAFQAKGIASAETLRWEACLGCLRNSKEAEWQGRVRRKVMFNETRKETLPRKADYTDHFRLL